MLESKIQAYIKDRSHKVLLIKCNEEDKPTLSGQAVCDYVNQQSSDIRPLIIDLALEPVGHIHIETILMKQQLSQHEIAHLKANNACIFIFINYGQIGKLENLYYKYNLDEWGAKSIIICPHQLLHPTLDPSIYFAPVIQGSLKRHLLDKCELIRSVKKVKEKQIMISAALDKANLVNEQSTSNDDLQNHFLNQKLFTNDDGLMRQLAERVSHDASFKSLLTRMVLISRHNAPFAIAAANAITILNYARVSFAHLALRGIRIPHANLSYAILYGTDLSYADLSHVNFYHGNLYGAKLTKSCLKEAFWGELASIKLEADITQCAYSAARNKLAVTLSNANIVVIDVATRTVCQQLEGHVHTVNAIDFHPTQPLIVSGGLDTTIKIWNENTGECLHEILEHLGNVAVVKFSKDGRYFASSGEDGDIYIWQTSNYTCVKALPGEIEEVFDLDFDNTNRYLVSTNRVGHIVIWDLYHERCIKTLADDSGMVSYCVKFSPDGRFIAAGGLGEIYLWTRDGVELPALEGHADKINSIYFNESGEFLVSTSDDNAIRLWQFNERVCQRVLRGHEENVYYAQLLRSNQQIVSASSDATVRFWPLNNPQQIIEQQAHEKTIKHLVYSRDGKYLATADEEGTIHLRLAATGQLLKILPGVEKIVGQKMQAEEDWDYHHYGEVDALQFSPDSSHLLASKAAFILSYNLNTSEQVQIPVTVEEGPIRCIQFNNDGQTFFAGTNEFMVHLYDLSNQQILKSIKGKNKEITSIAISADNQFIAVASLVTNFEPHYHELSSVQIWRKTNWELVTQFDDFESPVYAIVFSPDGKQLVGSTADDKLLFWSLNSKSVDAIIDEAMVFESNKNVAPIEDEDNESNSVDDDESQDSAHDEDDEEPFFENQQRFLRFIDNGRMLVSGDGARPIRIWSCLTASVVNLLQVGPSTAYALHVGDVLRVACTNGGEYSIKSLTGYYRQLNKIVWSLDWSSNTFLNLTNCDIEGVTELTTDTFAMLSQKGAQGKPENLTINQPSVTTQVPKVNHPVANTQFADLTAAVSYLFDHALHLWRKLFNLPASLAVDFNQLTLTATHTDNDLMDFLCAIQDLGKVCLTQENYQQAKLYLTKARSFADLLNKQRKPLFEQYTQEYTNLLAEAGRAELGVNNFEDAKKLLKQAIVLKKKLLQETKKTASEREASVIKKESPLIKRQYILLAHAISYLGQVHYQQHELADAEKRLNEANKIFQHYYQQFNNLPVIMEKNQEFLESIKVVNQSSVRKVV